ncbi:16S rRNA (cytosine(1402)-N(4))-methyltransferase RsmH [Chloroflexota bacterium]
MEPQPHISVLLAEVLAGLQIAPGSTIIDGTLGAGGHALAMIAAAGPDGFLLGIDRDEQALTIASDRLASFGDRVALVHDSFDGMAAQVAQIELAGVDAILLDLGVSSMHLDNATRGFSFRQDGPLDMRMDPSGDGPTAAEIVNTYPAGELAEIIWRYGEDRLSRQIARRLVQGRPYTTTGELAAAVKAAYPMRMQRKEKIHPATRTFQALRIVVNDELGMVERVLPQIVALLKPGGRAAIISFHSLEDRIVKRFFKRASLDCICAPEQPICTCQHRAAVKLVTRKPIVATAGEIAQNPRSRSAKLRVVERV